MHLLAAKPGAVGDDAPAVDLAQTPGDIVVLSAADTEIAALAEARTRVADANFPTLRLASLLALGHNLSVDLYVEATIAKAKLVVVRLLGGRGYWPYGVDEIARIAGERSIPVAFLAGDDQPDSELARLSTVSPEIGHRFWQYFVHGGVENLGEFLRAAASQIGWSGAWREPRPLLRAGLYWPGLTDPDLAAIRAQWSPDRPTVAVVFYRALLQAGNLAPVDALVARLGADGMNAVPVYITSLKDDVAAATVAEIFGTVPPAVVLAATGFSASLPGARRTRSPLETNDAPILQAVFAGVEESAWRDGSFGLSTRDIAMNVALTEVDGRILSRAVSFKGRARRDAATEADIVAYQPVADRIAYVSKLARGWATLRATAIRERRVGFVLANYPSRDGRIGNGVGLDTPASMASTLAALESAGYRVEGRPATGDDLMRQLMAAPTNAGVKSNHRAVSETLPLAEYEKAFRMIAPAARQRILDRWGPPASDPHVVDGAFAIPAIRFGNAAVGIQPSRGYHLDPKASYHDPDLVPPHAYVAFYVWLMERFEAQAVVHMGKHGNLEWLPGKAMALSADCFPEAVFAAVPHLYPFIVNDPGEGTQAKRRTAAVIIDHLTPPLTRAESYGPLRNLEQLVDEYYEAAGLDPRRLKVLKREILSLCATVGLDAELKMGADDDDALARLDNYLCELKEMQIRDGLHVFGASPTGTLLDGLLVALARVPRGTTPADASLLRALADDMALGFDPLEGDLGRPWTGPKPTALGNGVAWRTVGDTVERLESVALDLVRGRVPEPDWTRTRAVVDEIRIRLKPAVEQSGAAEIAGLLTGLDGRFVEPGPSGAPTRGRPEVLPTGRNFYSLDTRTVPTPAAWALGWKSATLLLERHLQDHGAWPASLAITAWGTSAFRTGGDDIAQALALIGVRPRWDAASRRTIGFEILPLSILDRPRVDVMLRVSGFFRDALPNLIELFDAASRAVADLDEPAEQNPLAARVRTDTRTLAAGGMLDAQARRRASYRVFGSKPGAYGAGLQSLIEEKGWETSADLARAYVAWSGYAYGEGASGEAAHGLFESRLASIDAVVQNQDNREHDLLDSADYYQFEGGLAAAVENASGRRPTVYHADHSNPDLPKIRSLEDEIARVVRSRVVNPKWIRGAMRHGYKGAFEMAATVDYMFAFAAATGAVAHHHFDLVFDAYLGSDEVREFIATHNPGALADMAARFIEAEDRGLWRPRRNDTRPRLEALARTENEVRP